MGTFKAIKNKNQSAQDMNFTLKYMADKRKTLYNGIYLNTGFNCMALTAFSEMMTTKNRYRKADKRMFYQFVQSFPSDTKLIPNEVHQLGLEFVQQQFPQFEVLVSTHCNTKNLHNHILVNSVSFENGKKLHQNHDDLLKHRQVNDEFCLKFGEQPLPPYTKGRKNQGISSREYRSAMKGQSWKMQLLNTIDDCMKFAKTKAHFVYLMESEGYKITWTDSRKNITYTNSQGNKVRDKSLHENKYLKEVMENEFRIRANILGGVEKIEPTTSSTTNTTNTTNTTKLGARNFGSAADTDQRIGISKFSDDGYFDSENRYLQNVKQYANSTNDKSTNTESGIYFDTDSNGNEDVQSNASTGWETEREYLCQTENLYTKFSNTTNPLQSGNNPNPLDSSNPNPNPLDSISTITKTETEIENINEEILTMKGY